MASTINASTVSGIVQSADTSGVLALQTGGTTAVTVNASQNVGIGTTSPNCKLDFGTSVANQKRIIGTYSNSTTFAGIGMDSATAGLRLAGDPSGSNPVVDIGVYSTDGNFTWTSKALFDNTGVFKFNSGYGSVATAYGCRAWVNFNGTGSISIRGSGNVSSITDNGTGLYLVNFSTALPDSNFATTCGSNGTSIGNYGLTEIDNSGPVSANYMQARTFISSTNIVTDLPYISLAAFR